MASLVRSSGCSAEALDLFVRPAPITEHASGGQRPAPGATGSSTRMESGGVGYSCRGPWGGLEISATISPTDLSFASSAISAWDTTPTSRFSSSTTGSRRT